MQPLLILLLISTGIALALGQGTRKDFYSISCPRVKAIVRATVRSYVQTKPRNAPSLLRMFFHDCFVNGCDGSILIDGPSSEKSAPPNSLLIGFNVIDDAKAQLEAACPGVVSCADILALAARDAVVMRVGMSWEVQMGRRDGVVSSASDTVDLPGFDDPVDVQIQKFADKGLYTQDLVTLVGGHTIGTASCFTFTQRLYNFTATGGPDPSINPGFLSVLQALCPPNGNAFARVPLDTGSNGPFDTSYYSNLRSSQGVLESDQLLWADSRTQPFVRRLINRDVRFGTEFGNAMVKLGNVGVKTGTDGEIRRVCTATN